MPWRDEHPLSPRDIVRSGLCIGCGACVAESTGMTMDHFGQLKPASSEGMPSETFARICPFSPRAVDEDMLAAERFPDLPPPTSPIGRVRQCYVGHVAEEGFRENGSSGGMVSWVLSELLRSGRIDGAAHVVPVSPEEAGGRFFRYRISRSEQAIRQGAKSRYYPIELSEVLAEILRTPGRYAVVGVPCFIKAIRLLAREDPVLRERVVYTLGLFCGHMKSQGLVGSFAWQMGTDLSQVAKVEYRRKDPNRPASTYTAELMLKDGALRQRDWWNMPDGDWGAGFFQNSACDFCDDVVAETADIAFGDAWVEPYSSDGRGTNVVIVRSQELGGMIERAIEEGRLALKPETSDFVAQTQAAGLRQRREGLAYRLTWRKRGLRPRKRVKPSRDLPLRRKLVYRLRSGISCWSHRMFWLAGKLNQPALYLKWAEMVVSVYGACTYFRGRGGSFFRWLDRRGDEPRS